MKRRTPILFRLFSLVLCSCANLWLPSAAHRTLPPVSLHLGLYAAPSGIRVIVDTDPTNPMVSMTTLIKGGGVSDPKGLEGLSHVVSHLSLRSHTASGLPYYRALEQAGVGAYDVHSTFDYTAFEAQAAATTASAWLPLEFARLEHPLEGVDEATFDLTREIVRNELRERREMVEGADFQWIQEAAFPEGHPYRRPVLGSHESLDALTLADARASIATAFEPRNITVHLSGNVDQQVIAALHLRALPIEAFANPSPPPSEPFALPEQALSEHSAGVPNPRLYLVWTLPPGYSDADELVHIASELTSQTLQEAWHFDEDVMGISARPVLGARASLLVVTVDLFQGTHPSRTMEHVINYVFELSQPFALAAQPQREFESLRGGYVQALHILYDLENTAHRSRVGAADWAFTHRLDVVRRHLTLALDVRPAATDALFIKWVNRDRARGVLVWPMSDVEVARREASPRPPAQLQSVAHPAFEPSDLQQLAAPMPWKEARLENGLRVVVVPKPGWPVASVTLAYLGGAATGPLGAARLTEQFATPRFVTYGRPVDYGLRSARDFEPDLQVLRLQGKAENLPNTLAQLSTLLDNLHIDSQLQTELSRYEYPFKRLQDELAERRAERELMRALLPSSALGLSPVTGDLEKLSVSEVSAWANDSTPDGAVLAVVGDVDPDQVVELAKTWLGSWSGRPAPAFTEAARPAPQVLTTVRPGASQCRVRLVCRVDAATPVQRATGEVLTQLIVQAQNDTVRDELGVTAGFEGQFKALAGGSAWIDVSALVDGARLDDAVQASRANLARLATASETAEGLERARWSAARKLALVRADSPTLSWRIATLLARGRTSEEVAQPVSVLSQVTAEGVSFAMKACGATAVTSLVGGRSELRAAAPSPSPP